jgi:hypothetical protein
MLKALSLLSLLVLGGASAPKIHVISLPGRAIKGSPWRAVISVSPPTRATQRATGPGTRSVRFVPMQKRGRYRATLRFPFAGTWQISAQAGRTAAHLGFVFVDVAKDPLVVDPIAIAAEPLGSLVVGQLRQGPIIRIAHAKAQKVADSPGVFNVCVAGETVYATGRDGVVYRIDGASLTPVTPPIDADAVAVDSGGNVYVTVYAGWVKKVAPDGTVSVLAGDGTEGELFHPHALVLGNDGALYIADTENRRIARLDLSTGRLTTFGGDVGITVALAVGPDGSIYSADVLRSGAGGGVTRTTPAGVTTRIIDEPSVNAVAVSPDGAVYVNQWEERRISMFDSSTGKLVPVVRG